jgi:hypothetical protein
VRSVRSVRKKCASRAGEKRKVGCNVTFVPCARRAGALPSPCAFQTAQNKKADLNFSRPALQLLPPCNPSASYFVGCNVTLLTSISIRVSVCACATFCAAHFSCPDSLSAMLCPLSTSPRHYGWPALCLGVRRPIASRLLLFFSSCQYNPTSIGAIAGLFPPWRVVSGAAITCSSGRASGLV